MHAESTQYFHKAIIESAPISLPFKTTIEALFLGDQLATKVGCIVNDMECLYKKTADEITQAQADIRSSPSSLRLLEFFEPWGPYVDGKIVPYQPLEAMAKGLIKDMPILIGTCTEETRIYVYEAWNKSMPLSTYGEALLLTFPQDIVQVITRYPPTNLTDERDNLVTAATDFVFTCCTRNYTRGIPSNNTNVFKYVFDQAFSFDGWGANFSFCRGHVCHGSEIPYVFQSATLGNMTFTPAEQKMSDAIVTYWSNFVKTGNPNKGSKVPPLDWPVYSKSTGSKFLRITTPANIAETSYRDEFCNFWDSQGYTPF